MTRLILTGLTASTGLILSCTMADSSQPNNPVCNCDTAQAKKIVKNTYFNRISEYDTVTFAKSDFYDLDSSINRVLWIGI
jgi:hypothetical protein